MNLKLTLAALLIASPLALAQTAYQPVADFDRMDHNAVDALASARAATDAYVHAAEDQVRRDLEADAQYRRVRDQEEDAHHALERARADGRLHDAHEIEEDLARLADREHHLRDAAFAASTVYQRARSLQAQLAAPTPPPVAEDPRAHEIANAIAEHRLTYGMSLDEANRAVGYHPVLVETFANVARYRWEIMGQVDTVVHRRDPFHRHDEVIVPDYTVVGHWRATFTDGHISDFSRVD